MRCIAEREAALDAGMAFIGLALLVAGTMRTTVSPFISALEGAANAAIRACRQQRNVQVCRCSITAFLVQRGRRAGLHAGAARHALRSHEIRAAGGDAWTRSRALPSSVRRSPEYPRRRECSASTRCICLPSKVKYGLLSSVGADKVVLAGVAVAHIAQGQPCPPCPAVRNRHWPSRSGNSADDRRCRAPSRHGAVCRYRRSACARSSPPRRALCRRPG